MGVKGVKLKNKSDIPLACRKAIDQPVANIDFAIRLSLKASDTAQGGCFTTAGRTE